MNVIELFKNDLWNGVWQHSKKLLKPMIMPTAIATALSLVVFYVAYILIKPMLPPEIFEAGASSNMEEIAQIMLKITESITENLAEFMVKIFAVSVLGAVLSAWYYNIGLLTSQRIAEHGDDQIKQPINSFGPSLMRVVAYGIILAVGSIVISVVINYLQTIMPMVAVLLNLLLQLLLLRLYAGRAWIVLGNQSVVDGLKLSWEHITIVRAIKLILIMFVALIALGLTLGLIFGLSLMLGQAGVVIILLVLIATVYLCSVIGIAGLSASFYRYVEVEYEGSNSAENHIIDTAE